MDWGHKQYKLLVGTRSQELCCYLTVVSKSDCANIPRRFGNPPAMAGILQRWPTTSFLRLDWLREKTHSSETVFNRGVEVCVKRRVSAAASFFVLKSDYALSINVPPLRANRFPTTTYFICHQILNTKSASFRSERFLSFVRCVLCDDNVLILVHCCCFIHALDGGKYLEKQDLPFKKMCEASNKSIQVTNKPQFFRF